MPHEQTKIPKSTIYEVIDPESERVRVNAPLVRTVGAEGIVSILSNEENLNSTNLNRTFFYCYSPQEDEIAISSYGSGTADIGFFVIFPREANEREMTWHLPYIAATEVNRAQEVYIEVDANDPENSEINHDEYLFIDPSQWEIVKECESAEAATAALAKAGLRRQDIERTAVETAARLVENRRLLTEYFSNTNNDIFASQESWHTFCADYLITKKDPDGIDEIIERDYDHVALVLAHEETLKQYGSVLDELRSSTLLRRVFTSNAQDTQKIVDGMLVKDQHPSAQEAEQADTLPYPRTFGSFSRNALARAIARLRGQK